MEKISLSEAINTARQMANHYKHFEKLGEVLRQAAEAEALCAETMRRKDKIDQDIKEAMALMAENEKEYAKRIAALSHEEKRMLAEQTRKREAFELEARAAQQANIAVVMEYRTKSAQLISEYQEKAQKFQAEEAAARLKLADLQEALESLRRTARDI